MTALSADRKVERKDGLVKSYKVKAGQQIYMGAMVVVKADGYAYAGVNEAGAMFVGVAMENVLGVTDGVERVRVHRKGLHKLVGSSLGIANINDVVYLSDDQTISTSATNVKVGVLVDFDSATEPWVDIEPITALDSLPVETFIIPFSHGTTVGASAITLLEDCELPRGFNISAAYVKCQTAPGGAYVTTVTLTDGSNSAAVTITGAATKGEDETLDVDIAANTDFDITIVDDDASAATDTVQGYFVCTWA